MAAEILPSDVTGEVTWFDRFAGRASLLFSRSKFFAFCVIFVALWLVQGFWLMFLKGPAEFTSTAYQLEINSSTTIMTFIMMALLNNSQTRDFKALHHKISAIANFLAETAEDDEIDAVIELRKAVGLELKESA